MYIAAFFFGFILSFVLFITSQIYEHICVCLVIAGFMLLCKCLI